MFCSARNILQPQSIAKGIHHRLPCILLCSPCLRMCYLRRASSQSKLTNARWQLQGRAEILKVHSRDKRLAKEVDLRRVARATAGSTGADLMNLMNQSAILAVRAGRNAILETDILQVRMLPIRSQISYLSKLHLHL